VEGLLVVREAPAFGHLTLVVDAEEMAALQVDVTALTLTPERKRRHHVVAVDHDVAEGDFPGGEGLHAGRHHLEVLLHAPILAGHAVVPRYMPGDIGRGDLPLRPLEALHRVDGPPITLVHDRHLL
jgi:hypothetical protein